MTQHGTSVVIKQTNDGPGSAEQRPLEMLQIVARHQMNQETEAGTSPAIYFLNWFLCSYPSMHKGRQHTHTFKRTL